MGNDIKNPRDKTTIKKEKSFSKEKINNSVSYKKIKKKKSKKDDFNWTLEQELNVEDLCNNDNSRFTKTNNNNKNNKLKNVFKSMNTNNINTENYEQNKNYNKMSNDKEKERLIITNEKCEIKTNINNNDNTQLNNNINLKIGENTSNININLNMENKEDEIEDEEYENKINLRHSRRTKCWSDFKKVFIKKNEKNIPKDIQILEDINIFNSILIILNNNIFIQELFDNKEMKKIEDSKNNNKQNCLSRILFYMGLYLWNDKDKYKLIAENILFEKYKNYIELSFEEKFKDSFFNVCYDINNTGKILEYIFDTLNTELSKEYEKITNKDFKDNKRLSISSEFMVHNYIEIICSYCQVRKTKDESFYYLNFNYNNIINNNENNTNKLENIGNNDNINSNQMLMNKMNNNYLHNNQNYNISPNQIQMNGKFDKNNISQQMLQDNNMNNNYIFSNQMINNGRNLNNNIYGNNNPMIGYNNNYCINQNQMLIGGVNLYNNNAYGNYDKMNIYNNNCINQSQMLMGGGNICNNYVNTNYIQMNRYDNNNNCINQSQMLMGGSNLNNNFINGNYTQMNIFNNNNLNKNHQINTLKSIDNSFNNNNFDKLNNKTNENNKINLNNYFENILTKNFKNSSELFCQECKKMTIHNKIIHLTLPKILSIELSNNENNNFIIEDELYIKKQYLYNSKENDSAYLLIALLCQISYNKKFICYSINSKDGLWYSYTDGIINKVEEIDINSIPILAI